MEHNQHILTRRSLMGLLGAAAVSPSLKGSDDEPKVSARHLALLDEIQRRACLYFYEQSHPLTGLVRDRAQADAPDSRRKASIAATGFGLSALCIAETRGYLPSVDMRDRAEKTLEFLARKMPRQRGFYYHFIDWETGERDGTSELSSIDTTWLLCGVLHARAHFDSRKVRKFANEVLNRVDWRWMLNRGTTLSHGWTPESGFLPYRWDQYSELLAMYLLAMSSTTFPIPASSWDAWERPTRIVPGDLYIDSPAPLFVHQYSHAWFDFRGKQDGYSNYFLNSRRATEAHRQFCMRLADRFPWMGADMWGITASDSRRGYVDWGGPNSSGRVDGTLVPCATGGSVVFLPHECLTVLDTMLQRYGKKAWTRYGFVDAFHPGSGWYNPDVIGIDVGIMLLMAENYRTGSVWQAVMSTQEAASAMKCAAFQDVNLI